MGYTTYSFKIYYSYLWKKGNLNIIKMSNTFHIRKGREEENLLSVDNITLVAV